MPRMIDALNALTMQNATRASAPVQAASVQASTAERIAETAAVSGTVMTPMSPMSPMSAMTPLVPASSMTMMSAHSSADANDSPERPATSDAAVAMLELGDQTQQAMAAMTDLARGLPATLAQHAQATSQTQLQSVQAMKTLSARLEGVASGIETSGRKTLETVAARMMQSEANMVSRHHAVAEHLGELVQRIEALCGLLQHDRVDESQNGLFGYESPGLDSSGFEQPSRYSEQRRPAAMYEPTPRSRGMSRQPKVEYEDGNEYDDGGYPSSRESDGRYDRNNDTGSFGS